MEWRTLETEARQWRGEGLEVGRAMKGAGPWWGGAGKRRGLGGVWLEMGGAVVWWDLKGGAVLWAGLVVGGVVRGGA